MPLVKILLAKGGNMENQILNFQTSLEEALFLWLFDPYQFDFEEIEELVKDMRIQED